MRKTGRSTLASKKEKDTKLSFTINGIYYIGHLIPGFQDETYSMPNACADREGLDYATLGSFLPL